MIRDVPVEKQNSDAKNRPRAAIIGLYTALARAETEWLAVLACALPFVTGELFERLVFLLENGKAKSKIFDAVVLIQPGGGAQSGCAPPPARVLFKRRPRNAGGRRLEFAKTFARKEKKAEILIGYRAIFS